MTDFLALVIIGVEQPLCDVPILNLGQFDLLYIEILYWPGPGVGFALSKGNFGDEVGGTIQACGPSVPKIGFWL